MDQRHLTGWEIESQSKRRLDAAPHGKVYCVFWISNVLERESAQDYIEIGKAIR